MECIINAQEVAQLLKIPVSQSPTREEHTCNFTFYCSPPQGRRYRGAGGVHAAATKIQVGPTMYQRATYMRDGSPVPLPGHIQDVRETTAVPGAPAKEVGCRSANVPASSLRCMPQFLFLSPLFLPFSLPLPLSPSPLLPSPHTPAQRCDHNDVADVCQATSSEKEVEGSTSTTPGETPAQSSG